MGGTQICKCIQSVNDQFVLWVTLILASSCIFHLPMSQVMNCCFVLPWFLNDNITGLIVLGWWLHFSRNSKVLLHLYWLLISCIVELFQMYSRMQEVAWLSLLVLASNKSRCDPHLIWSTFNMKPHRPVGPPGTPIFILFFFKFQFTDCVYPSEIQYFPLVLFDLLLSIIPNIWIRSLLKFINPTLVDFELYF